MRRAGTEVTPRALARFADLLGKTCRGLSCCGSLERFQVLDQVRFLLFSELEAEQAVVVIDDVEERGEAAVVEKATLRVREEALERRRPVSLVGRPVGPRNEARRSSPALHA